MTNLASAVGALLLRTSLNVGMSAFVALVQWMPRRSKREQVGCPLDVLLTGTFHSPNWVQAHAEPLARSNVCRRLRIVSLSPLPALPGVEWIEPPKKLQRLIGGVPARLAVFTWLALRDRPEVVGGFHLLLNGLCAILVGRVVGASSIYFSVGGPEEIRDGGLHSENRLFGAIGRPSPSLQRKLLAAARAADQIVTMGSRAAAYFDDGTLDRPALVLSGGISSASYLAGTVPKDIDIILVGRLAPIKRIDLFIDAIAMVRESYPAVRATVVGDGELRDVLRSHATARGLDGSMEWAGQQVDVRPYLERSRVFCLTSDSEGLALSLMEAAMCGVPAVVSHVGDLGDLVENGVNGYLVDDRRADAFAAALLDLITDESRRRHFGIAARTAAERYDTVAVAHQWDRLLSELSLSSLEHSSVTT